MWSIGLSSVRHDHTVDGPRPTPFSKTGLRKRSGSLKGNRHANEQSLPNTTIETPDWLREMETILEELNEGVSRRR